MTKQRQDVLVRGLDTIDFGAVAQIDEKIGGEYRPDVWDRRLAYYLRRDPEAAMVAEIDGQVVGFMLAEVRSGEFGLEETTGWIEVVGIDPDRQGQAIGRQLADALIAHFKSRDVVRVRTLVDDKMEGIASFFSSLGFEAEPLRVFAQSLA
jgi:ribosomal protein S18 acetylase RimI-like enzyme